jgi:hypothetical protein
MEKVVLGTMPDRTSVCGVLQGHVRPLFFNSRELSAKLQVPSEFLKLRWLL